MITAYRSSAETRAGDLVEHVRVHLQRRDDDLRRGVLQRLRELAGVLVDLLHHARRVVELVDRPLQLPVEHDPVGDHDDLVEHRLGWRRRTGSTAGARATRSCSTSPTRPNARPGSSAPPRAPARPRPSSAPRATDETAGRSAAQCAGCPWARFRSGRACTAAGSPASCPAARSAPKDKKQHNLAPNGAGFPAPPEFPAPADPTLNGRNSVSRPAQPRRDERLVGVHREVHQRPPGEEQVVRVPPPVLGDRVVLGVLPGLRVLQLHGSDRQPVDEERQVHRLRTRPAR